MKNFLILVLLFLVVACEKQPAVPDGKREYAFSWAVADDADVVQYEVEVSTDGRTFEPVKIIPPGDDEFTAYITLNPGDLIRVKAIEVSGNVYYSRIKKAY